MKKSFEEFPLKCQMMLFTSLFFLSAFIAQNQTNNTMDYLAEMVQNSAND